MNSKESNAQDTTPSPTQPPPVQQETTTQITVNDTINERVSLDKKYYYLGYHGIDENIYYTIKSDGNATYDHIMKTGEKITFHQVINFKWTYAKNGDCILVHNGTTMIKGEQDEAFGISRVMHLSKQIMYWSASGENSYFICEDYLSEIPNYAKLINA